MKKYRKALTALAAGAGVAASLSADGSLSQSDWVAIVAACLGALGVYAIPNTNPPSEED